MHKWGCFLTVGSLLILHKNNVKIKNPAGRQITAGAGSEYKKENFKYGKKKTD